MSVSFNAPKLGSVVTQLVGSSDLEELRAIIPEGTYFSIRSVNRTRSAGTSARRVGKDWNHPARYGSVLAKLEAIHLVENNYCDACEVELRFSDSYAAQNDISIVGVRLNTFSTVKDDRTDDDLREMVWERCSKMNVDEIKKAFNNIEKSAEFFVLDHGGSSCAPSHTGVVSKNT